MELKGASFQKKAFTLLELMIGVAVIAVIAAIAIPSFMKYVRDAREAELTQALLQAKRAQDGVIQVYGKPAILFEGPSEYLAADGSKHMLPKLDYRVSSTPRFNLIVGAQIDPELPSNDDSVKYRFDQLYPEANLHSSSRKFGIILGDAGPAQLGTPNYLIGLEANFDSDSNQHVMGINQSGVLFKFCDDFSDSENSEAINQYVAYGFGDMNCDSAANQNGDNGNGNSGDGNYD